MKLEVFKIKEMQTEAPQTQNYSNIHLPKSSDETTGRHEGYGVQGGYLVAQSTPKTPDGSEDNAQDEVSYSTPLDEDWIPGEYKGETPGDKVCATSEDDALETHIATLMNALATRNSIHVVDGLQQRQQKRISRL